MRLISAAAVVVLFLASILLVDHGLDKVWKKAESSTKHRELKRWLASGLILTVWVLFGLFVEFVVLR
jgi:hypothetical protein